MGDANQILSETFFQEYALYTPGTDVCETSPSTALAWDLELCRSERRAERALPLITIIDGTRSS